jgi:hypothetical protein
MDPAASSSPPLSRTPPPCGSKRRLSSRVTNLTQYIQRFGYRDAASEDGVSSSSEGEDSLVLPGVDGIEMLIVSPMPSLRSDSDDSDGELEIVDDLQLPAPLVGVPSPMPSLRSDSDDTDSDADIGELADDDLQLPAPLVGVPSPMPSLRSDSDDTDSDADIGELADDDLQLPAPLVGVPSPRLGFRVYPNPLPMTWGMLQIELICLRQELEENGELHLLQLPAPLVVYTVVESQTRGPMHAHLCC